MATETVKVTVIKDASGAVPASANQGAIVAPLDGTATVSANVVKKYRRVSDAEADHGVGSLIAKGVEAALAAGLPTVWTVAAAAKTTSSPKSETTASGTLPSADLPVYEVSSASHNGTALTVKYTHEDPATMSPAPSTSEFVINTKTGKWKTGAAVSSTATLTITYKSYNWSTALNELSLEAFEYITLAGIPYNAQHFGDYDKLLSWAATEKRMVATGLASGAAPADVKGVVEAVRNGRLFVGAAYYSGDFQSAMMAHRCVDVIYGTAKEQVAPAGVTYSDSYLYADYGDEESPGSSTFHGIGVNAVYKDKGGTYRLTNDRASTSLTDFYRFHSTFRNVNHVETKLEDALLAMRRASSVALPFTNGGIARVRATLEGQLIQMKLKGIIDSYTLVVPNVDDVTDADKANRILNGVEASVVLPGQIHMIKLDLKVKL